MRSFIFACFILSTFSWGNTANALAPIPRKWNKIDKLIGDLASKKAGERYEAFEILKRTGGHPDTVFKIKKKYDSCTNSLVQKQLDALLDYFYTQDLRFERTILNSPSASEYTALKLKAFRFLRRQAKKEIEDEKLLLDRILGKIDGESLAELKQHESFDERLNKIEDWKELCRSIKGKSFNTPGYWEKIKQLKALGGELEKSANNGITEYGYALSLLSQREEYSIIPEEEMRGKRHYFKFRVFSETLYCNDFLKKFEIGRNVYVEPEDKDSLRFLFKYSTVMSVYTLWDSDPYDPSNSIEIAPKTRYTPFALGLMYVPLADTYSVTFSYPGMLERGDNPALEVSKAVAILSFPNDEDRRREIESTADLPKVLSQPLVIHR